MSKIKIETITSVHIGSGETLMYGNDFVYGKDSEGYDVVSIIDPAKVMRLIGEENVHAWVAAIENKKSTKDVVKRFSPNSKIEDYSKRILTSCASIKETDTLKEFIHDGFGKPYIPGSSIKGAIRTAILASLAKDSEQPITDDRDRVNAQPTESYYFGKNPNDDVFRFLQVGDAYFGDNYEGVIKMVNLNERLRREFWDTSKPQLVEVLLEGDCATFNLSINDIMIKFTEGKVHAVPECFSDIHALFKTINSHTKDLLNGEIKYWNERKDNDTSDKTTDYITQIKDVLKKANSCNEGKSCVLRIGHGSGWRFITGAWTECREDFRETIVPKARPNADRYSEYAFPKSRRVDDGCNLLGFVKLSICE
ncbi:MAG: type III-A CRISPR-associated RAMP protein Csm5 [Bacteroidaceae bacterium]|nr:type III-A CRISPR-associated RAMP protein Csm5 [Bacteroidaceae bacterium]